MATTVFLLSSSTSPWTVPGDFVHAGHTVEGIGCGGNGGNGSTGANSPGASGGSGGGYGKFTYSSGTFGSTVLFAVQTGGAQTPNLWQNNVNASPVCRTFNGSTGQGGGGDGQPGGVTAD